MTSPIPVDPRKGGSNVRTGEVMLLPMFLTLPYDAPPDAPNPHDDLKEDVLCGHCAANFSIKPDPGPQPLLRRYGQVYVWIFAVIKRNHRCPICRLIWQTFKPFVEHFKGLPDSQSDIKPAIIMGFYDFWKDGTRRKLNLVAMRFKLTVDNQDTIDTSLPPEKVMCYVYEHEQIPRFAMTHPYGANTNRKSTFQHNRIIKPDKIDFKILRNWIDTCESKHLATCERHSQPVKLPEPKKQTGLRQSMKKYLKRETATVKDNAQPTTVKPTNLPKRLVDVNQGCIVSTKNMSSVSYLALSYTWATDNKADFCLTKSKTSNCGDLGYIKSQGDKISQIIHDSIYICQQMRVDYLWIDGLCIAQDDHKEKNEEIRRMDDIYSQAQAVLAIAVGENGILGIHGRKRDLPVYQDRFVDPFISSLDSSSRAARISKWNTRAWTFQENMLARRIIFITDTYAFFRCSSSFRREDYGEEADQAHQIDKVVHSDDAWVLSGLHDIPPSATARDVFETQYKPKLAAYLRRDMTFDSDSLLAFTGILNVLAKYLGGFHFGLPERYFGVCLLWDDANKGIFKRRAEFPSWSWAGWQWDFRFPQSGLDGQGAYPSQGSEDIVPLKVYTFDKITCRLRMLFDDEAITATFTSQEAAARQKKLEADQSQVSNIMSLLNMGYEEGIAQMQYDMQHSRIKTVDQEKLDAEKHQQQRDDLLLQLQPPKNALEISHSYLISKSKNPDHFIAFYTSVATLKIDKAASRQVAPESAHVYQVRDQGDEQLFSCHLDPKYRDNHVGDEFEFAVVGFKPGMRRVILMLLDKPGSSMSSVDIYHRVNWACNLTQQMYVEDWLGLNPKQRLVVLQ